MRVKHLMIGVVLATAALLADDSPTVDLFAGWSWSPRLYGYPYGPYSPWWREMGYGFGPYSGASRAWPHCGEAWGYDGACLPGYGWGWGWGCDYGVRLHLDRGSPLRVPQMSDRLLPPLPGSAPTELRNVTRENAWDRAIESFLATLPPSSAQPAAATNAPAR